MSGNNSVVVKSAFWYTASNLLVKASGFLTIPIFTRMLTQAEYGEYNNFLTWTSVVGIVTSMSLESTLISAKYDFKEKLPKYVLSISVLSIVMASAWWILTGLCMSVVAPVLAMSPLYINAMFIYLVFQPVVTIFQTYERFQFRYVITVITSSIVSIGSAFLSVALVFIMGDKLSAVVIGRVLPMIIVGAVLLVVLGKEGKKIDLGCWFYALPIALPFIPHLLSMNLLGSLNKIFIQQICGAEQNGLYSLANNCALVISILTTSLNGAFAPWLGEKLSLNDFDSIRTVARPYIILFALLAVGVSLIAPELMMILGGDSYASAASLIPPISMGCVFQFAYCMYVNIEQFKKKTVGMAFASFSAALLNALLDIILIPRFGYAAAAFATAISYGWLLVVHMLLVARLSYLKTYDTKLNVAVMAGTAAVLGLVSLLYGNRVARFIIAVIILVALGYVVKRYRTTFSNK